MAGFRLRSLAAALALVLASGAAAQELTPEKAREADRLIAEGLKLLEGERFEKALGKFEKAGKLNEFDVRVPFYMAQCEFDLGFRTRDEKRIERARELLKQAERMDPRFGGTYFLWGIIGIRTGKYSDAVLGFQLSLKRGYKVKDSRANLAQALFFYGVELAKDEDRAADPIIRVFELARDHLEVLKDDLRFNPEMRANFRDLWLKSITNLAAMRQRANDLPQAERLLKQLMKLEPKNYLHPYNLGLVYGSSRQWDQALEYYRKALELCRDPDWLDPYPLMAYIYSMRGEPELAEKYFQTYLAKHPDDWRSRFQLADHYLRNDKLDLAIRGFERCLELSWEKILPIYKLNLAYRKAGKTEIADRWLSLFQQLDAEKKEREKQKRLKEGAAPDDGSQIPTPFGDQKKKGGKRE